MTSGKINFSFFLSFKVLIFRFFFRKFFVVSKESPFNFLIFCNKVVFPKAQRVPKSPNRSLYPHFRGLDAFKIIKLANFLFKKHDSYVYCKALPIFGTFVYILNLFLGDLCQFHFEIGVK